MATVLVERPRSYDNLEEFIAALGGIPLHRIRMTPLPGMATEKDLLRQLEAADKKLCELVDGVLVEKAMGAHASSVAMFLGYLVLAFVSPRRLGKVFGADGTLRLFPGLVRIPDISFVSAKRLKGHDLKKEPIPDLAPDLAAEILSDSNTTKEMERKVREYFEAGVRLVWIIDPETESAEIYTSPQRMKRIGKDGFLDGGKVLPGFFVKLINVLELKEPAPEA